MDKISVIIPVYNVEPYIRQCLNSIINQTYSNLEIICVDDGSTDNSGMICDEYAEKDKRIKVFHKKNGGVSSAKNIGLENCTGQYIGFVDSDDWIEPNMYEVLYRIIKDKNVDISVVNYYKDIEKSTIPMVDRYTIPYRIISVEEMLLYPLKRDDYMGFCAYLWNKLFDANIINNNKLRFDKDINYGEDVLFYIKTILAGKCVGVYFNEALYHYRQISTSISKTKKISIRFEILTVYKKIEDLLLNNGYSDIAYWARGFYCFHASVIADIAIVNKDATTLELMKKEIKLHIDDYVKTNRDFPGKFARMNYILRHSIK